MKGKGKSDKKFNFTMTRLRDILPPERADQGKGTTRRDVYFDSTQPGLRLLVTSTGNKSFQFQMWSKKHQKPFTRTLGKLGVLSLGEARKQSASLVVEMNAGVNIETKQQDERLAIMQHPTVEEFAERFVREYRKPNGEKKKSWKADQAILENKVVPLIGRLKMNEVKRADIKSVIKEVSKKRVHKEISASGKVIEKTTGGMVIANRVLACVKTMFNFAVEEEVLDYSICLGIKKPKEKPRDRTLNEEEIMVLFSILSDSVNHKLIKFLLITGQRSSECREMAWTEIEDTDWIIPAERTKSGKTPHVVPLSSMAKELLDSIERTSKFVFASNGKCLSRYYLPQRFRSITEKLGWDKVTPHDLRRTCKTMMSKLRVKPYISERVLNHSVDKMEETYDKYDYREEKALALQIWSDKLEEILSVESEREVKASKVMLSTITGEEK